MVQRFLPRIENGEVTDALTSSSTSPLELEPVPADADVPLLDEGRKNSFLVGMDSRDMVADTRTLPSTSAVPSSQALVRPSSTETATAMPAMPSLPVADVALVTRRSVLSARTYRLPPTWRYASSMTWAVASETTTFTAALRPMPLMADGEAVAVDVWSVVAWMTASSVVMMSPATVTVAFETTTLAAPANRNANVGEALDVA